MNAHFCPQRHRFFDIILKVARSQRMQLKIALQPIGCAGLRGLGSEAGSPRNGYVFIILRPSSYRASDKLLVCLHNARFDALSLIILLRDSICISYWKNIICIPGVSNLDTQVFWSGHSNLRTSLLPSSPLGTTPIYDDLHHHPIRGL